MSGASSSASVRRGLLVGQDEADEVGARLDGGVDVLLAGQPADLDERPAQQLAQRRSGIGRAHQRRADEHRVRPGELGGGRLRARRDATLGDQHAVAGHPREQGELAAPVDRTSTGRAR